MKSNTVVKLITRSLLVIVLLALSAHGKATEVLNWSQVAELPPIKGQAIQPGLAGAFCGIHNDALIIAGGANFAQPVWESKKVWHDDIYVLVKESAGSAGEESYRWITGFKLENPIAYGPSVSSRHGIVCTGGNDSERTYSQVSKGSADVSHNHGYMDKRRLHANQSCNYHGRSLGDRRGDRGKSA